ncbi:MAG: cyanophycin synthetase, partial [Anaerolineales bacterium]|nr:cyanophycin synthetase [Anaerolineales bacterium]
VVFYGKDEENEYSYTNITSTKNGLHFDILHNNSTYNITSPLLGIYMVENICGAFAMASELGIQPQNITQSIRTFLGMRRRLEKRCENNITVFDDIAHSPEKAAATLATLRSIYTGKIIAIYEPNTGNRNKEAVPQYAHAFAHADSVIIPRLSAVKQGPNTPDIMDGKALSDMIATTHQNTQYIEDDNTLVAHLVEHTKKEDVVVFLGSHGFRGMIEMVCEAVT